MDGSANVTSIDAIRDLRAALVRFGSEANESIVMLTLEARKAVQWLMHDRARYWPAQLRKAQERVSQASHELDRCQLHYGSEEAPSCFLQKKALEKAKRRLRICEEKVQAVKRWTNALREELEDFDGEIARMTNWVEGDLPRALALLERLVRALDRYAGDYRSLGGGGIGSSTADPNGEEAGEDVAGETAAAELSDEVAGESSLPEEGK